MRHFEVYTNTPRTSPAKTTRRRPEQKIASQATARADPPAKRVGGGHGGTVVLVVGRVAFVSCVAPRGAGALRAGDPAGRVAAVVAAYESDSRPAVAGAAALAPAAAGASDGASQRASSLVGICFTDAGSTGRGTMGSSMSQKVRLKLRETCLSRHKQLRRAIPLWFVCVFSKPPGPAEASQATH